MNGELAPQTTSNPSEPTSEEMVDASKRIVGNQVVQPQEAEKEEGGWSSYRPIGSTEYEQANQDRIADGKIKLTSLGSPEHNITLVASIKVDPGTGQVISGHENRPEAESMADTEKAFADYLASTPVDQRTVIYEGDERLFDDRDEAIRQATDSGLIQRLAKREGVATVAGEPTDQEFRVAMEQMGVSQDELLALEVARGLEGQLASGDPEFLSGYLSFQAAKLGLEGFHNYSEEQKEAIAKEGKLEEIKAELDDKAKTILPILNGIYAPALGGQELFVVGESGVIGLNPNVENNPSQLMELLGWSGSQRINEVFRLSMEVRDRVIYHRILDSYRSGKSPFVVYGGSHIVTMEPALKTYLA